MSCTDIFFEKLSNFNQEWLVYDFKTYLINKTDLIQAHLD